MQYFIPCGHVSGIDRPWRQMPQSFEREYNLLLRLETQTEQQNIDPVEIWLPLLKIGRIINFQKSISSLRRKRAASFTAVQTPPSTLRELLVQVATEPGQAPLKRDNFPARSKSFFSRAFTNNTYQGHFFCQQRRRSIFYRGGENANNGGRRDGWWLAVFKRSCYARRKYFKQESAGSNFINKMPKKELLLLSCKF